MARRRVCRMPIGGAFYLGGEAAFRRTLGIGTPWLRSAAALVSLASAALGIWVSAVAQLGGLVAIFIILFVAETLHTRSQSAGLTSVPD